VLGAGLSRFHGGIHATPGNCLTPAEYHIRFFFSSAVRPLVGYDSKQRKVVRQGLISEKAEASIQIIHLQLSLVFA
jgi:hypothetical protein